MINLLVSLLIVGVVIGVIWWLLDYLPVPEPFNKIIKVVAVVVFLIYIISLLLGLGGVDIPQIKVQ